jgi:hypothetical protein
MIQRHHDHRQAAHGVDGRNASAALICSLQPRGSNGESPRSALISSKLYRVPSRLAFEFPTLRAAK